MEMNLYWFGMLTTGNVEKVAGLLGQLLNDRYYTAICAHPTIYPKTLELPETVALSMDVRTSQKLSPSGTRDGKAISWGVEDGRAHLTLQDTFGLYMLDSNLQGERSHSDSTYRNPYFVFDGNKVTIHHRAPAGNLLVWTFATEDHSE